MSISKNIIVLGSSRLLGHTWEIASVLASQINAEIIHLKEKNIAYYNYDNVYAPDDFLDIIRVIQLADNIVFATPVYWYSMSAQLKTFFDRFSDLVRVEKELGRSLEGKKMFALSCGSDETMVKGFEVPFISTADYLNMEFGGYMHTWKMTDEISEKVQERISDMGQMILRSSK